VTEAGHETLKLFSASTADGRVFTPRSPLPTNGAAFHAQLVTAADGRLWAAWDEAETGTPRRVRLARAMPDRDGVAAFEGVDLSPDADGSHPALTATPDSVVVAWTTRGKDGTSTIAVRRIAVPLE